MNTLTSILEKLEGLTPWEVAAQAALQAKSRALRAYRRAVDLRTRPYLSDQDLRQAFGGRTIAAIAKNIREGEQPHLTKGLAGLSQTAAAFRRLFPDSVTTIEGEAAAILEHRIRVFGRLFELGPCIDWHADPSTGTRWPLVHFTRVPVTLEPGSDVRTVWELNRLQHLTTLGRAFALNKDERYAREFLDQVTSWCETNPPRFGPNWCVAMEVAIRAVNLVAALELFRSSTLLTDDAIALVMKLLIAHGRFIRGNLEFSYRITSNHYLSDLIGLFVLGNFLSGAKEANGWREFSTHQLFVEMNKQVLADGVDYEGTTGYHRFVLEIFVLFFALGSANGVSFTRENWSRLEGMFDFVRHYLKPDGTAPTIGDSDDGRLLRFKERTAADHSYLMSLGAVLLESGKFRQTTHVDEEALWWFGEDGVRRFDQLEIDASGPGSKGFTESQIYVQRHGSLYAIVDCGDHGAGGRGSHAHSDALSIEIFAFDRTFLRDPGTFAYTADPRARDLFRSTAFHNTVRIDGRDISLIREGHLFSLGPNVRPEIRDWKCTDERDVLDALHRGYGNLAEPVVHRRLVTFEKGAGYWTIKDTFTGTGIHQLNFFFNLDMGLEVSIEEGRRAVAFGPKSAVAIVPSNGRFKIEKAERWVSAAYGTRTRSSAIIYRLETSIPFENSMLLIPYRLGDEAKVEELEKGFGPDLEKE